MLTFAFSGQGSQKTGMGGDLFDRYPDLTGKADTILGYSIRELCLQNPGERLTETQYTQPALFVVNAMLYLAAVEETGRKPDYLIGHSVGEYNALWAAGAFDFETALILIKKRSELMARARGGGMAAVIGLTEERVKEILEKNRLGALDIANYNAPRQFVLAGLVSDVEGAQDIFEREGADYIILRVSGAFHSRYMKEFYRVFKKFLKPFRFSRLTIPVLANVDARPYPSNRVKERLADQLISPVRWSDSIHYLMAQGDMEFREIGPGTVLIKLIDKIRREAPVSMRPEAAERREPVEESVFLRIRRNVGRIAAAVRAGCRRIVESPARKPRWKRGGAVKSAPPRLQRRISPDSLGSREFRDAYGVRYPYVAGGMWRGIASGEMVVRLGKSGMIGYFGTYGLALPEVEAAIRYIRRKLSRKPYGMNLVYRPDHPQLENDLVRLFLKYGVRNLEISGYLRAEPALVRYRLKGVRWVSGRGIETRNRLLVKVADRETAGMFLAPAPRIVVERLLDEGQISADEARLAPHVPMADDICLETGSRYADRGPAQALLPAIIRLRDRWSGTSDYPGPVRVGLAGGIGTPEAAAAAFVLGADFILTGSINQCTVESGVNPRVKDLLSRADEQDTDSAPAGEMFELGARMQFLSKGQFYAHRAKKLYDLYCRCSSLEEIGQKEREHIQAEYLKRSFRDVFEEIKRTYPAAAVERALRNPRVKMALIFRWFLSHSADLAVAGDGHKLSDYQIACSPAMGAFNRWVEGTALEDWHRRHVDGIADMLMQETANTLNRQFSYFARS